MPVNGPPATTAIAHEHTNRRERLGKLERLPFGCCAVLCCARLLCARPTIIIVIISHVIFAPPLLYHTS